MYIYIFTNKSAIGGYYGGKLAKSGQEVHFLLHKDYEYVKEHGLQINSCDGNFHLDKVNAYNSTSDMPACDIVLVCLKSTNNHLLKELLPPLLHSKTLVVLIENGIGVEEDIEREFPGVQLAAGLAFICSAKTEPGLVNHQCYGSINIGNYSCRDEEIVNTLVSELRQAEIEAGIVEYREARWKKAVWNMPFNGMTVALNTQTDLLLKNPATRQLIRDQMMEVVGAAQHLGVKNLGEDFVERMIQITDVMTPYSPSMKLDFDFHRPMEIKYIYSRPIEIAREAGYRMSKLEMLEAELKFLQSMQ
eukprot:jgi/Orpsp1_1/1174066/evm.model.c7180000048805.1